MINLYNVIIVGAGLAGLTLAHALSQQGLSCAIIEKNPLSDKHFNTAIKTDGRALAMSLSAQRILHNLGLWESLASFTTPIQAVHVSEQGCFGKVRLSAADMGWDALGYIVPYACLMESLLHAVQTSSQIKIFSQTEVIALNEAQGESRSVLVRTPSGETLTLSGRVVMMAEGHAANIKDTVGFVKQESTREQYVIVADVMVTHAHHNIAYQRFTKQNILAVLPRAQGKVTVVWTIPATTLAEWQALSDKDWLARLQTAFGYKLGLFTAVSTRHYYPVKQFTVENPYQERLLLLGNAAHALSPVAAQGFNLTLRDIAMLVELLTKAHESHADIGDMALLKNYQAMRMQDQKTVYHFTDKLIEIFSWPYLKGMRSLGLLLCDLLPGAKHTLIQRTEGFTGVAPRLMTADLE